MIARNKLTHIGLLKTARSLACNLALALLLGLQSSAFAHAHWQSLRVEGVVTDQSSAPIAGAEVTLSSKSFTINQTTNGEGRFVFYAVAIASGTLTVRARGFATVERTWSANEKDLANLNIALGPALVAEQITITAERTETRVSDTAASVAVLSAEDITTTAALTLDDVLRQIPGFSLFRRSGSRTANPTSQGVSLRAVGASGASRAVVLADGIPVNDPFGGWVYWGRVPRESVSRIEVVQGGASHLYGTDALGGVINLITRETSDTAASIEMSYGNQNTAEASLFGGWRRNGWGARVSAEAFNTDGYILVDEDERGRVDTRAGGSHSAFEVTLDKSFSDRGRAFIRGSVFGESRENGTPLQQNRTHIRQLAVGGDWQSQSVGSLSARAYGGTQIFDQDFSAIAADRDSETLTRSQRVPAEQLGVSAQWSRAAGSRQTLVAGLDSREVRGASDELVFVGGRLTSAVGAGGRERAIGVFGQDIVRVTSRLFVTVGARADRWRNYNALSATRPLAQPGPGSVTNFADRTETAFSPRLSVLHKLTDKVSFFVSGYRAFRAPTLNELYRSFRVGNILTLANDKLRAERLTGGEAGASLAAFNRKLNVRGTFFWSEITRPVANVTLTVTPDLITRQRQNLGRTRSRGLQLETEARITNTVSVTGGYQFADATVLRFPTNTSLEGLLIPQVARHQLTFQARYSNPQRVTLAVQGRAMGSQFDDDQNRLRLDRFFVLDAFVSRQIVSKLELFAAAENLFNQRYDIGRTPVRTVGPPLLARIGLRFRAGSR